MEEWFVSKEEASSRLDICVKCPNLVEKNLCNLCGCYMDSKVLVKYSKCPIGKW
jgi:recombinational DNA repair protein RecR